VKETSLLRWRGSLPWMTRRLGTTLRTVIGRAGGDLEALTSATETVAARTMQPASLPLWLRPPEVSP
jgi:hypothetical protein